MIRLLEKIPETVGVAVSGGIDSMVTLDFLQNTRRDIKVIHVNHGTNHAPHALKFVKEQAEQRGLEFWVNREDVYTSDIKNNKEEAWRNMRYEYFHGFPFPIITAHHLDDCLETWLFSSFNGTPKTIPYQRDNVIRPFLLTKRDDIVDYACKNDVDYIYDMSNSDLSYTRNYIRHNIVPDVLTVNPGIHKMIAKMVRERYGKLVS